MVKYLDTQAAKVLSLIWLKLMHLKSQSQRERQKYQLVPLVRKFQAFAATNSLSGVELKSA